MSERPAGGVSVLKGYPTLILLLAIPLISWALPADHFDQGDSVCISVLLLDLECYGCGMTRGLQHLMHLDYAAAAEYNVLSLLVLPVLIYLWGARLWSAISYIRS